jgi:flavin-dependent dehydrogenase
LENTKSYDVLIIGAGPAGSCAAALLKQKGLSVAILERELFPRFSIGESLLPQSMVFLEKAGLLDAVNQAHFQKKNGAAFLRQGEISVFNFEDKSSPGPHCTFQVQRAKFDKVLADTCEQKGVEIFYRHNVNAISITEDLVSIEVTNLENNENKTFTGKFILDASGFGRSLPKLLKLDRPSDFPKRRAVFGHMKINFPESFDVNKILVTVSDTHPDVWLWTIPFSNTACSMGVVATEEFYEAFAGKSNEEILRAVIAQTPKLQEIMEGFEFTTEIRSIVGYSSDVSSLYGKRFALLGNAGEFLDPVFSSGVTIALHSASLAANLVDKELKGETVNWEKDFSDTLKVGVRAFKTFVKAWYTGELQSIIFYPKPELRIKTMICSVLAGYAWDMTNPYVVDSDRAVRALASICSDT